MKYCIFIKSFLLTLFLSGSLNAQGIFQVVTKKIEKTLDFRKDYILNIEGEKADIKVKSWKQDKVKVELELVAKHSDKAIAEEELELMQYLIELKGKEIFIRNYINKDPHSKPKSNLHAHYVITIPEDCPLNLKNYFGIADIKDLHKPVAVNSEYCKIKLSNIEAEIFVQTRFGDVIGDRLNGPLTIQSTRSDITLTRLTGPVDIKAKYGIIKIDASNSLMDLKIDAEKSDVFLMNPSSETHSFTLTAHYGKITVPDNMEFNFKEQSPSLSKAELNLPVYEGTVSVKTSFGNIVVGRVEM